MTRNLLLTFITAIETMGMPSLWKKSFKRKDHLNRHLNCVHGGENARKFKWPYPGCNSQGYCESYHLQRHIEQVHEKIECNMCLSTFSRRTQLEAHLVSVHGVQPPYVWVVWKAFFFKEKSFEMHIKRHENEKPIQNKANKSKTDKNLELEEDDPNSSNVFKNELFGLSDVVKEEIEEIDLKISKKRGKAGMKKRLSS